MPNILSLISRDFIGLIGLSMLISIPIVWYTMHQWLQGYAYRTGISSTEFVIAGLFILLVAVLTISFHALKAALMNPVKSLRAE